MKNKILSLLIIFIIYIAAISVGAGMLLSLRSTIANPIINMLIADIAATVVVYIFSIILKNASIYDPYWSVMPPVMVLGYYLCYGISFSPHHLFVLIPLIIWAIRLTYNWITNFDDLSWQDWRYVEYKKKYPKLYQLISFFGIMMMPTCLVFAGTIPLWFFLQSATVSAIHIIGGMIVFCACFLQTVADWQMKLFKAQKKDSDSCIDCGVWRYSRHPNYFGEMSVWWGIAFAGLGESATVIKILSLRAYMYYIMNFSGAVLISLLFIFISVPLMEKHIISKRPSYLQYKNIVRSPLLPFFRAKNISKDTVSERQAQTDN